VTSSGSLSAHPPRHPPGRASIAALGLLLLLVGPAAARSPGPAPKAVPGAGEARPVPKEGPVTVKRVFDGDTIQVRFAADGAEERVRIIGIDTPETGREGRPAEYGAADATARTKAWLEGRRVRLVLDPLHASEGHRDRFGRLLAYVDDEAGADLGLALLREGRARLFRKFDFARRASYVAAEAQARREGLGLWWDGGDAEFMDLRSKVDPIAVYPAGGNLWAVCVDGQARTGIESSELAGLLWDVRAARTGGDPAALAATLARHGFRRVGSCARP
jgi:micrococcal nuclease